MLVQQHQSGKHTEWVKVKVVLLRMVLMVSGIKEAGGMVKSFTSEFKDGVDPTFSNGE